MGTTLLFGKSVPKIPQNGDEKQKEKGDIASDPPPPADPLLDLDLDPGVDRDPSGCDVANAEDEAEKRFLSEVVSEASALDQEGQLTFFNKCHKKIVFRSVKIKPKDVLPSSPSSSSS